MDEPNEQSSFDLEDEVEAWISTMGSAAEVVDRYTHCSLCHSRLHFSHVTDFSKNLTQELIKCPECGVKVRRVLHKLQ